MSSESGNDPNTKKQASETSPLRVGTRLATDAYSPTGVLVLPAGHVIENERQLDSLQRHHAILGSQGRGSEDSLEPGERPEPSDPKAKELEANIRRASSVKSQAVRQVSSVFQRIETGGEVEVQVMKDAVSVLVEELLGDQVALASLVQIKNADSFTHSVNVAILAMYLAIRTQFEDDLERIGTGAILHDIGKVGIPLSVLRKKGPLTEGERQMIRRHPQQGVDLLRKSGFGDGIGLSCVLDHHEKLSGAGYPRGKHATDISPYARITELADVYDALTTPRPYRNAMTVQEALRTMSQEMAADLDPWLLERFVAAVGCFTERTTVTSEGEVVARSAEESEEDSIQPVPEIERSIIRIDEHV
jgi:putative nucleotidyltransferase with HDIG domain